MLPRQSNRTFEQCQTHALVSTKRRWRSPPGSSGGRPNHHESPTAFLIASSNA
jgi:hypothetical protein